MTTFSIYFPMPSQASSEPCFYNRMSVRRHKMADANNSPTNGDGLLVEERDAAIDIVPNDLRHSLLSYSRSKDAVELLSCFSFLIGGIILEFIETTPRMRPIPFQVLATSGDYAVNQIFNEAFEGDTVGSTALMILGGVVPYVIQMIASYFVGGHKEFHKTSCVFFAGLGLTVLLTNSVKLYVGYLRPIFYEACEPDENYEECTSGEDREARLSFPSGHASFSFCGLVLLSLYLERSFGITKLRVWKHDESTGQIVLSHTSYPGLRRIISILCYAPVLLAGFIAASRVADNKHFPADVVGGSILGSTVAALVHGLWFPSWPTVVDGF